jgi:hypothetical protein
MTWQARSGLGSSRSKQIRGCSKERKEKKRKENGKQNCVEIQGYK